MGVADVTMDFITVDGAKRTLLDEFPGNAEDGALTLADELKAVFVVFPGRVDGVGILLSLSDEVGFTTVAKVTEEDVSMETNEELFVFITVTVSLLLVTVGLMCFDASMVTDISMVMELSLATDPFILEVDGITGVVSLRVCVMTYVM